MNHWTPLPGALSTHAAILSVRFPLSSSTILLFLTHYSISSPQGALAGGTTCCQESSLLSERLPSVRDRDFDVIFKNHITSESLLRSSRVESNRLTLESAQKEVMLGIKSSSFICILLSTQLRWLTQLDVNRAQCCQCLSTHLADTSQYIIYLDFFWCHQTNPSPEFALF